MKVAIIEEKETIAEHLWEFIGASRPGMERVGVFTDFGRFLAYLKVHGDPDLLLVDMQQLDSKALDFVQAGHLKFPLLFTNYFKVSGQANECLAAAAAQKKIQVEKLNSLLSKVQQARDISLQTATLPVPVSGSEEPRYQKRFLVKSKQHFRSIRVEDIAGFFSEGRLIFMHTKEGKKYIVNQTMDMLSESLLKPTDFFRVNRSMIVAFSEMKEIVAYFGGRLKVTIHTAGMKDILVSRERVPAFKKWLGE